MSESPTRAARIKKCFQQTNKNKIRPYSRNKSLAMFADWKLTLHKYKTLYNGAKERNSKSFYPSHVAIQHAKKQYYPDKKFLTINDTLAETKLRALRDLTVVRLAEVQRDVLSVFLKNAKRECWKFANVLQMGLWW